MVVGRADDPLEADADRRADTALSRLVAGSAPQGHAHDEGCGHVHRSADAAPAGGVTIGLEGGDLDAATAAQISGRRGAGRPLEGGTKDRMETAFGTSLAGVRIHDDSTAAGISRQISAEAFTTGNDIFFGAGRYAPETPQGERVLAHELGHVLQGRGAGVHRSLLGKIKSFFGKDEPAAAPAPKTPEQLVDEQREKAISGSKDREKQQGKDLKDRRVQGTQNRAELTEQVYGHSNDMDVHAAAMKGIGEDFKKAQESEMQLVLDKKAAGLSDEAAIDAAYRETWLEGPNAKKFIGVAPPRATEMERLRSAVAKARTEMSVREKMDAAGQLGGMLSRDVEAKYEQYVTEVNRLMSDPDNLGSAAAAAMAEKNVWGSATPKIKAKRPLRGSALDVEAVTQARMRLGLRPTPEKKVATKTETAESALGTTGTVVDVADGLAGPAAAILGSVGKKKDKAANPDAMDKVGAGIETKIPVAGDVISAGQKAQARVDSGQKADKAVSNKAPSDETRASNGITSVVGILSDIQNAVLGGLKFAAAVQKASDSTSPRTVMAAAKSGADGARTLLALATKSANLAKVIDPGVTSAVASVIPGFNIATSALSIVSNALDMGDSAMRVHETNMTLADARARDSRDAVDVMVMPMLRVLQSYTKGLEKAVWNTSISIADLATAIATVASAGGYGIPAAVQAGVKAVDMLHSLGHFIADQVLVSITKKTQKDSVGKLEGSAEAGFKHDPTMAVDGIILRAAGGDALALQFLANYEVDGKMIDQALVSKIDPKLSEKARAGNEALLGKVRASVMEAMGNDVNPQFFYEKWKETMSGVMKGVQGATSGKWDKAGKLAAGKNAQEGTEKRGFKWKLKMMFEYEAKLDRSQAKLDAKVKNPQAAARAGVLCVVKGVPLTDNAGPVEYRTFEETAKAATDDELIAAARDPLNAPQWQDFLLEIIQDRVAKKAATQAPVAP